jgi:hypothetical protein
MCRKCGDVWHVVVAKVGDRIAKVQCKQCGGLHRHRAPGEARAASMPRRRASGTAASRPAPVARIPQPATPADLTKPIRPYTPRDIFAAGDRIDHPTFGIGVVEDVAAPGKINVFFPQGHKVLAQAKPESTMAAPPRPRFGTQAEE